MPTLRNRLYHLLRWSEKYTKTDMVYLTRGGFWSVLAQLAASLSTFFLAVLVARFLPKEIYGQYKYILAVVALLSSFSLTGLGTAVFQSVARGFDGALTEGFSLNLRWSILTFFGALLFAIYYFLQGNSQLAIGVLIGGSLSPLFTSANLAGVFLNAKKDFARGALYFGIVETLVSVGALMLAVVFTQNPLILVIVYFGGNTLATYLLYRRVVRLYQPDRANRDPGMLTYAKHISLMGIIATIAGNLDQILIFHFVGPIELALYNFAIAIPDQTKGLVKGMSVMLLARFTNRSTAEISAGMRNKMLWLFFSSITFVVLYALLVPSFFALFFPNYSDAVPYSKLYALSLLSLCFSPASTYLVAKKKVREQYALNISLAILQAGAMLIGVVYWGLTGLIVSQIIIKVGGGFLTYVAYRTSSREES